MYGQPPLVKTSTLAGLATATCLMLLPTLAFASGSGPPAAASARTAAATCTGPASDLDLNGDGYDDAVVGDPYATVDGRSAAGAIVVLYGDGDCRIGEGARRVITQSTAGVPGTSEAGDHFGWSVSIDDLTDDGRADILVGTPGEDVGSSADAGSVSVISFAAGSSTSAVSAVSLDQGDLRGKAEAGDRFGYTVAGGDSEGDESGSVAAAGAPGEDLAGVHDAGVVDAFGFAGGQWGLAAEFQQGQSGTSPFTVALPGTPQAGDRLGAALLVAQLSAPFTGDVPAGPQWTYVMGAPGDVVAGKDNAGSVSLSYTETGYREQLTQDSPDVPGAAEAGDQFGSSLAVHETRGPGSPQSSNFWRHVAVGSPGEDVGRVVDAGSVTLFRSREQGLEPAPPFIRTAPGSAAPQKPGTGSGIPWPCGRCWGARTPCWWSVSPSRTSARWLTPAWCRP